MGTCSALCSAPGSTSHSLHLLSGHVGPEPSLIGQPLAPAWCYQPLCQLWGSQEMTEQEQRRGQSCSGSEVNTWTKQEEAIFGSYLQAG